MKILPPADENERRRLKARFEGQLRQATGGDWRVDIVPGRYGWYARAKEVRRRQRPSVRDRRALLVSGRPRRHPPLPGALDLRAGPA